MKYLPWFLFGIAALMLVGFTSFYMGGREVANKTPVPTAIENPQTSQAPVGQENQSTPSLPSGWTTYANPAPAYSFQYPTDLKMSSGEKTEFNLSKSGPTQKEATEFYDGISLNFKTGATNSQTVQQIAEKRRGELVELFETGDLLPATLGKLNGFTFHVKGYAEGDYYFLGLGPNDYLEIFDATLDPSNAGFDQLVAQILKSLQ